VNGLLTLEKNLMLSEKPCSSAVLNLKKNFESYRETTVLLTSSLFSFIWWKSMFVVWFTNKQHQKTQSGTNQRCILSDV